jgi:hypothetical protein
VTAAEKRLGVSDIIPSELLTGHNGVTAERDGDRQSSCRIRLQLYRGKEYFSPERENK